jgi:hypothetical protein
MKMNLLQRAITYIIIYGLGMLNGFFFTEKGETILLSALCFGIIYILLSLILNEGTD